MPSKRKNFGNTNPRISCAKSVGIGVLCGVIVCSILLILLAVVFTKSSSPPHNLIDPIMLVCCGLGAFAGGYFSARLSKEKGALYGAASGFLMFIFIFISGLISVRGSLTELTLIRLAAMLISGTFGGIVGVNRKGKRR